MKGIFFILLALLFAATGSFSQSSDTTRSGDKKKSESRTTTGKEQNQEQKQQEAQNQSREKAQTAAQPETPANQALKGFVDVNGDGIDDRLEQMKQGKGNQKGKNQPKDRFIDTDGDGICDGNESALGLRKLYRKRKGNPNQ